MQYIDCKFYADEILEKAKLVENKKKLIIFSVGNDAASESYIKGKIKDCERCGLPYEHIHIENDNDRSKEKLENAIYKYNARQDIGGIILQLPLPLGWDEDYFTNLIVSYKDVDGLTSRSRFQPCTPEGIIRIMKDKLWDLEGLSVLVVGRGKLVGRPLFDMLLKENCTVTIAHSKTKNLDYILCRYDVIISAAGRPRLIDLSKCTQAKLVFDVGLSRYRGKLCGDCYNFSEKELPNLSVTSVPGGIGLMTRAVLIDHVANRGYFLHK